MRMTLTPARAHVMPMGFASPSKARLARLVWAASRERRARRMATAATSPVRILARPATSPVFLAFVRPWLPGRRTEIVCNVPMPVRRAVVRARTSRMALALIPPRTSPAERRHAPRALSPGAAVATGEGNASRRLRCPVQTVAMRPARDACRVAEARSLATGSVALRGSLAVAGRVSMPTPTRTCAAVHAWPVPRRAEELPRVLRGRAELRVRAERPNAATAVARVFPGRLTRAIWVGSW